MSCTSKEKYLSRDGRCCDRCPAGEHVKADCDATSRTRCEKCGRRFYTAARNHLTYCHPCRTCDRDGHQKTLRECTESQNTECECEPSYYCSNPNCDLCQAVTRCPPGEGVKLQATRTNNTVCAPCEDGTFSNVTDFISPCRAHIRCKDLGRDLRTPGTKTTDAVCGGFKAQCSWMLPAGLWSGLVLTALLMLAVVIWRAKRRSHRAVAFTPVTVVDLLPAPPVTPKQSCPHQESCPLTEDKLSFYIPEDKLPVVHPEDKLSIFQMEDKLPVFHPEEEDSLVQAAFPGDTAGPPITPLRTSAPPPGAPLRTSAPPPGAPLRTGGCVTGNLLRSISEPQEDEWCGT